jgi:hypothetical protein
VREKRSPLAPLPLLRWEATLLSHLEAAFELQWCTVGRSGGDPETVSSSAAAAASSTTSSSSSSSSSAVQLRRQGTLKPPVRRVGADGSIREGGLPPGSRPQGGGSAAPYVAQGLAPLMLPELRLAVLPRPLAQHASSSSSSSAAAGIEGLAPLSLPRLLVADGTADCSSSSSASSTSSSSNSSSDTAAVTQLLHRWRVSVAQFTQLPLTALVQNAYGCASAAVAGAVLHFSVEQRGPEQWQPACSESVAWGGLHTVLLPPLAHSAAAGVGAAAAFLRTGTYRVYARVEWAGRSVACHAPLTVIVVPPSLPPVAQGREPAEALPRCVDLGSTVDGDR